VLFIVIDLITTAVYIAPSLGRLDPSKADNIIRRACYAAFLIMMLFAIGGDYIMMYFNITLYDLMIALGIILLLFSVMDFLNIRLDIDISKESTSIVPIATPYIAGPAAISTVIYIKYSHGPMYSVTSIITNIALTYVILRTNQKVFKLLGNSGSLIINKVISLILAALAVSLIRTGILNAL